MVLLLSLLHSDSCRNLGLSSNPVTSNVMLQPGSSSEGMIKVWFCRNFQSSSIADVSQNAHALLKARFEQALESQKLNIKKTEQQLRRTGWRQRSSMQSTKKEGSTYKDQNRVVKIVTRRS
uniref:Uncharacterized protein n=1 Tax=Brassica oleracea TaxID=3712 RepID=A0A3P6D9V2_BRAOL|nr:unnamed protein product [Brassica oleracea]